LRLPSREEIHAAYAEGEEAVVALITGLDARVASVGRLASQEQPEQQQAVLQ